MYKKAKSPPLQILERLTAAKNPDEDIARREYIFNILMLGFIVLTVSAFFISFVRSWGPVDGEHHVPVVLLVVPVIVFVSLYFLSRKDFKDYLAYLFILLVALLGTYSLYIYGYILPQGLLIYVLVIIMSGVMISAKASLFVTALVFTSLSLLASTQINHKQMPYINESNAPLNVENLIIYIFIFSIIFSISWLSNREMEASLTRARISESELLLERNMLEVKVRNRTKELEKAQVEKSMELYRFAEFGRLSSSLLHDIANPLTAVSLNLDQLSSGRKTKAVDQVRAGVTHMEEYLQSARRQLRCQSDITIIDTKYEIEKVKNFLASKANYNKVKLTSRLGANKLVMGDSAKFSQIIANLIANGIDSYSNMGITNKNKRVVLITSKVNKHKDTILILIQDSGMGILKEEKDKVFNPFFTTKTSDRGTGIGLTITKQIVEEDFKGNIYFESNQEGTTFYVELPLST